MTCKPQFSPGLLTKIDGWSKADPLILVGILCSKHNLCNNQCCLAVLDYYLEFEKIRWTARYRRDDANLEIGVSSSCLLIDVKGTIQN